MTTTLPTDSQERKDIPLQRGCLDYFPAALAEVARLSQAGNEKHNPGEEMHHARGKSTDHADCIQRHQLERGSVDDDGFLHDVKVAWRALAQLQERLEAEGAPLARGARLPEPPVYKLEAPLTFEQLEAMRQSVEGIIVPVIHSIGPEVQECPNDPADRIAGCNARDIKDDYYGIPFRPGTWVRDSSSGWFGLILTDEEIANSAHDPVAGEYTVYLVTHHIDGTACHAFVDSDLTEDLTRVDPFEFGLHLPINRAEDR